jgi:hypothetical protein
MNMVSNKYRVADFGGNASRGVAGRVDYFGVDCADLETLAVLEEMIEFRTIARHIQRIEDWPEDLLYILDVLTDCDPSTGLQLDIGRTRQVVRMCVRFQNLLDFDAEFLRLRKDGVGRFHSCLTAPMIEIQNGVDHRTRFCRGIPHEIANGIGRLIEKSLNFRFCSGGHDALLFRSAWHLTYILALPNLATSNLWSTCHACTNRPSIKCCGRYWHC